MKPPTRSEWQPVLLLELRRVRKLRVAVDFAGVTLKTVRRHIIRDKDQLGGDHPCALGEMIREAQREYDRQQLERRMRQRRRRQLAAEEGAAERRVERARHAAAVRWERRR